MYTIKQEKRGVCPYDEKRYLFTDLPDGQPNPKTHAYGHCNLATEDYLVPDQPEPNEEIIIRHRVKRFAQKHARVTRRSEITGVDMKANADLPDIDTDGELNNDQLQVAKRMIVVRPAVAIQIDDVIKLIIARHNFERLVSPPA